MISAKGAKPVFSGTGAGVKPIFHCDAKPLASGPGVGLHPQRHTLALGIPTCWYLKGENTQRQT